MKKTSVCSLVILSVLLCGLVFPTRIMAYAAPKSVSIDNTMGDVDKSLIVALLFPKIEESVNKYYDQYFTHQLGMAPYFVDVLSINGLKREPRNLNFSSYKVKVEISPYVGPHIPVGTDQITLVINMMGDVQVEKFDHIKSYELPWNHKSSAKGAWPPSE